MEIPQFREPWNKGKLVGQKPPLKPKDIWAIRLRITPASSPTFICHTDVQLERGRSNLYLSVFLSQDPAVLLKQAVT